MKVFVTGAGGFLGRAIVARLLEEDCDVLAMVRPASTAHTQFDHPRLTLVRGDLRQGGPWQDILKQADTVIHAAAALSGDLAEQFAGTVQTTETLLASLGDVTGKLVHVSSFSVYDFADVPAWSVLDEKTPVEDRPQDRDAYTWTKLIQEGMMRDHALASGRKLAVIRPGAIYGPGKDWDYGAAIKLGSFDLMFSPLAPFRLTHVANCADAIVLAALRSEADGAIFNVVDDDLPSHWGFRRRARKAGARLAPAIWVPWPIVALAGHAARLVDRLACGGKAKLPEFVTLARQRARYKPIRYSNQLLKERLGWRPRVGPDEAIRSVVANAPHLPTASTQAPA